jgi:transcriptional regulator with XRE-family HTH domain
MNYDVFATTPQGDGMNRIKEIRTKKGLSQVEVARRARVAAQNLSAVERGRLAPWPKLRKSLVRILGAPECELFPNGHEETH